MAKKPEFDVEGAIQEVLNCSNLSASGRRDVVRIIRKLFRIPERVFSVGSRVTILIPRRPDSYEVGEECIIALTGIKNKSCRLISLEDGYTRIVETVHVLDTEEITEEEVIQMAGGNGFRIQ